MVTVIQTIACCKTDPGLKRTNNEDVCLVNDDAQFYLVADGVGGNVAGEVASKMFLETVTNTFDSAIASAPDNVNIIIKQCFYLAHKRLLENSAANPDHKGMGCTAEILAFNAQEAVIGHVGDSRTYLLRDKTLSLLTDDHSFVFEQVKAGVITAEEAKTHHMRNVILRAVGIEEEIEVDVFSCKTQPGDLFLLCTDGLTDMAQEEQISELLLQSKSLEEKAEELIKLANQKGGRDNIAVALVEVCS